MNPAVICPKCSYRFALDDAIIRQLESELRQTITAEFETDRRRALEQLKKEAAGEAARALTELQITADLQAKQLKDARENELALLHAKAELQGEIQNAVLKARRELENDREHIRRAAQQQFLDEHRLRDADKDKRLDDLRRQIEELKQKAEQGSQQLQGSVQELDLKRMLCDRFPKDEISAIKTGTRGADLIQKVASDSGQYCGMILWESKRTRHWSNKWVDKLLADKESAKADLAVIVTNALPSEVLHMGAMRGVLLTTLALAPCLAATLRVTMAFLAQMRAALAGQDDQKSRVFQYFHSSEFVNRLNSIAQQFEQMQTDLAREKTAITKYWARRESQIAAIAFSTAKFAGELRSLYGPELPAAPQFQLPVGSEAH
ncbi:MAG: hypothetical protein QOI07_3245 [Verrucomicrobiota bacterium]|jgi:hypothetical protein